MNIKAIYSLCPIIGLSTFYYMYIQLSYNIYYSIFNSLLVCYTPAYLNRTYMKDGLTSKYIQYHYLWKYLQIYFDAYIDIEEKLDSNKQYLFCNFPHGAGEI